MRAPRRTPWASQADLVELYDMIYSSAADDMTRQRAVSRMSLYLSSPSCPAFIHLLHSLLSSDLLPVPKIPAEKQAVRLTCAMSIVRFINGMVDPLQTGPYARPISHIAATLNIPPSLIALRHRATHEDLPPLPLLKQAIHSAIEYINQYSFLPSLASTSTEPMPRALRAQTLVERWKRIIKSKLKAETSEVEFERESRRLKRELDDEDVVEVAEALASVGGLVPLARKKRPSLQSAEPTKASLQIWTPLLDHLVQLESSFVTSLIDQLFALAQTGVKGKHSEIASVRWSAIVWILWFWSDRRGPSLVDSETKSRLRKEIMTSLINGSDIWQRFAEELSEIDPVFETAYSGLEDVLQNGPVHGEQDDDALKGLEVEDVSKDVEMNDDDVLAQMEARLAKLARKQIHTTTPKAPNGDLSKHDFADRSPVNGRVKDDDGNNDHGGWKQLDDTCWRPCPIGVWGAAQRA